MIKPVDCAYCRTSAAKVKTCASDVAPLSALSLARWIYQLRRVFSPRSAAPLPPPKAADQEIDPARLNAWLRSMAADVESTSDQDDSEFQADAS